jgi:hypothetical protein
MFAWTVTKRKICSVHSRVIRAKLVNEPNALFRGLSLKNRYDWCHNLVKKATVKFGLVDVGLGCCTRGMARSREESIALGHAAPLVHNQG